MLKGSCRLEEPIFSIFKLEPSPMKTLSEPLYSDLEPRLLTSSVMWQEAPKFGYQARL